MLFHVMTMMPAQLVMHAQEVPVKLELLPSTVTMEKNAQMIFATPPQVVTM